MNVLRKGSRDEDVKTLQKLLNIVADGIFGAKTEMSVKAFQTGAHLTPDGIVGPKTWAALGVDMESSTQQVPALVIKKKPLTVHLSKRNGTRIKYLVIHFTGGSHSRRGKALACYDVFTNGKASADYAVDDVDMVQLNPDPRTYYCWAVGDSKYNNRGGILYGKARNANCISIEICSTCTPSAQQAVNVDNHEGWSFTPAVLNNATRLARHLMKEYDIPLANVIRHYDVTGKLCPGIPGWNDEPIRTLNGNKTARNSNSSEWEKFLSRLTIGS